MINGLEGIPGSGKSYEAAVFQVLVALKEGRKVITNLPLVVDAYAAIDPAYRALIDIRRVPAPVRGTWDVDRVDPDTGDGEAFELFADGHVEKPAPGARVFGTVWDYWSDWKHPKTGRGPLFVIDECHIAMPKLRTDAAVIEWYKLHRHFNSDVLLATQKFRDMCQDIAGLMAMVIKVRKADVLGRPDSYIRKVHAGYRGAVIQEGLRKYEPHFFALYKSHTQGNSVLEAGAADVAPISVKLRRWTRIMWGVSAVACVAAYVFWNRNPSVPSSTNTVTKAASGSQVAASSGGQSKPAGAAPEGKDAAPVRSESAAQAADKPVMQDGLPEPYAGLKLHLTGCMQGKGATLCTFAVAAGGKRVNQVTSSELVAAGYKWKSAGDCVGWLTWGGSARAVVCDAPDVASGKDKGTPVVIERPVAAVTSM